MKTLVEYIIIFLITLKEHPMLSMLALILLWVITRFIFIRTLKKAVNKCLLVLLVIYIGNMFGGHFVTNFLINEYGSNGYGIVINTEETSKNFNGKVDIKYNVVINGSDFKHYSTYCLTSDSNIVPTSLNNKYFFPTGGVKFNVKYIKKYPRAFVIISDDQSEYSKSLRALNNAEAIQKIRNKLKMNPNDSSLKDKLNQLIKEQTTEKK